MNTSTMNPDVVLMLIVAGLAAGLWYAHRSHISFVAKVEQAAAAQRQYLEEEIAYREYADQQYSDLHRRHMALHQQYTALQSLYAIRTVELLQLSVPLFQRAVAHRKRTPGQEA